MSRDQASSNLAADPDIRKGMGLFERYLSVWVALAIVLGLIVGQFLPVVPETLSRFE